MPTIKRPKPSPVRTIRVGSQVLSTASLSAELQDYVDVLIGRVPPPEDFGELTLYELASVYYARAKEIEMVILRAQREGIVKTGSSMYRFRTGELRSFIELAHNACELGSRRVTYARMEQGQ